MTINVMVNGLPGKMATNVSNSILINTFTGGELRLIRYSLTGPNITEGGVLVGNKNILPLNVFLIKPKEREEEIGKIKNGEEQFISVDYTHPDAVNENADFYCKNKLPFVMGTTGGDREALEDRVENSEICAVIAPNMAKQIVAFQAMMKYAAETFPGAFKDYNLDIMESHQKGKVDTSGTAKAMVDYFNLLGIPFTKDQIKMIRDPEQQLDIGVPEQYLGGHGWHTYTLKTRDGNVLFQFTHNINGRDIYAEGTLDAIKYLQTKIDAGEKGKVYSMIDVLKGN